MAIVHLSLAKKKCMHKEKKNFKYNKEFSHYQIHLSIIA
jgi:hypothetical protein